MNVQLPARLDKAAFLDWVERQGGRFELVKGRVVMMVGDRATTASSRATCFLR
jgi:hypothetical protein